MDFIPRDAESSLLSLTRQFKVVALVGPWQSGKTTLAKHVFRDKPYVSLEDPDIRSFALEDTRGFLSQYKDGAVFDEIQRAPDIFSYLQQIVDGSSETGQFILTGSNNFLVQENISQSLAGRVGYLWLLPFSHTEIRKSDYDVDSPDPLIFNGGYPPVYDQPVETPTWYANYIRTYVERDVRQIKNIGDLSTFERFLKLCAGRIGNLINKSSLALETGVDVKTVDSWLGVLESSFIIYRMQPYHRNFNKRIVKMPKLYFYDTGLVCALLGLHQADQLSLHYLKGNLFENFVINELLKSRYNSANLQPLHFWRDSTGREIDIIMEYPDHLYPVEIKSGQTITKEFFKNLEFWKKLTGSENGAVIYAGNQTQKRSSGIAVYPWNHLHELTENPD